MDPATLSFLLALQASGMIVDYMGTKNQADLSKMGSNVEESGIDTNIALSRLQSEEDSLESMKQLRQNLGTQAAQMAARGTQSGQGSAVLFGNESLGNFNSSERLRKLNEESNEVSLKGQKFLTSINQKTNENNLWNQFKQRSFKSAESAGLEYAKYKGY